ncbi:hypothetical protein TNCV_2134091 [Trichonephila clavipes]|nr:hypothetical protein TNCV_2134091 [Trichonephila clavipes]
MEHPPYSPDLNALDFLLYPQLKITLKGKIFEDIPDTSNERTSEETEPHYRSHLSCHRPQSSMERFTNTKLEDMHMLYGLLEGNARAAERLYPEMYPQRYAQDHQMSQSA